MSFPACFFFFFSKEGRAYQCAFLLRTAGITAIYQVKIHLVGHQNSNQQQQRKKTPICGHPYNVMDLQQVVPVHRTNNSFPVPHGKQTIPFSCPSCLLNSTVNMPRK